MILVIDNYDSFTYNLVHYLNELGAETVVHRNDAITVDEAMGLRPEALLLSPGPCTPNEAGICVPLIQRFAGTMPILGVCLGHQSIGQAFGGEVVRNWRVLHGKTSAIRHRGIVAREKGRDVALDLSKEMWLFEGTKFMQGSPAGREPLVALPRILLATAGSCAGSP